MYAFLPRTSDSSFLGLGIRENITEKSGFDWIEAVIWGMLTDWVAYISTGSSDIFCNRTGHNQRRTTSVIKELERLTKRRNLLCMKGTEIGILKLMAWLFSVEERGSMGPLESNEEAIQKYRKNVMHCRKWICEIHSYNKMEHVDVLKSWQWWVTFIDLFQKNQGLVDKMC